MKNPLKILFVLSIGLQLNAQTPKFINYQGLARDASGIPITNQSVALGFTITNGSSAPFTDSKNATTNTFGLFNTTIGSSSNPINSNLSFGSYSLIVSINGSVLPSQLLASVPYALNAPEPTVTYTSGVLSIGSSTVAISSASYQAGNGISINSGSIINTAPNQSVNITSSGIANVTGSYPSYNVSVPSQSLNYNSMSNLLSLMSGSTSVNSVTLNNSATSNVTITGTGNASVSPTSGSNFTVNVPFQSFAIAGPTVSSNLGGSFVIPAASLALTGTALSSGPLTNSVSLGTLSPWVKNTNTVSLSTPSDSVIIGNGVVNGKLSVYQNNNSSSSIYAINTSALGSNSAHGIYGLTNNDGAFAAGVKGESNGQSIGVYGVNLSSTISSNAHGVFGETNSSAVNAYGVYGKNNNSGSGVYGETNSTAVNAYGVYGRNKNSGSGVFGRAESMSAINAYGVYGQNIGVGSGVHGINTGSISNNNAHGVLGITQNPHNDAAGVFGSNDAGGPSIFGIKTGSATGNVLRVINSNNTNLSSALYVETNSGAASGFGVSILNTGSQASLYSHKTGTATGNAAYFENLTSTNPSEVLKVVNNSSISTSPAINAMSNSNTGAIGIQLQDAHLKSIGTLTNVPTFTASAVMGFTPSGNSYTYTNCSDVKGQILLSNTTFTTIISGEYLEITVPFNKPYSSPPIVVASPVYSTDNASKFSFFVKNVTPSNFTLRIENTTGSNLTLVGVDFFTFNYFVIE